MFLAAAEEAKKYTGFDVFTILFTIIIAIGVIRLLKAPEKNRFALGFGAVCLAVFLLLDVLMVLNWVGLLDDVNEQVNKIIT